MRRTICSGLSLLALLAAPVGGRRQSSARPLLPASSQARGDNPLEAAQQNSLGQRLEDLSQQISREMSDNQKHTIAVVEFADLRGNVTDLGRFLAEELITRLYQTKKFKVIERQLLNKVITEQKLSLTGLVEQGAARQLGKLLGVDAIASGTVTDLGKSLRVNARLINAGTGEIFAVASTEIVKDESVLNLVGSGVGGTPPDQGAKSPSSPATKEATQKVTVSDISFELTSCKRAGQTVTCGFIVTNTSSEDMPLQLFQNASDVERSSRMFDNLGNEYRASGQQYLTIRRGSVASQHLLLVPQVPTKAALKFENVNPEATTIKLLRVAFELRSNDWGEPSRLLYADFRELPIAR